MSLESYNNPTATTVPANIDAIKALMSSPLVSFVRTGFDGDTVIVYMRPERVHGLKGVKLELLFDVPNESSVTAAVIDKSCEKRNFDSVASASGPVDLQYVAVLAEFLGKTLKAAGHEAKVELEVQVTSKSGDVQAANELLSELTQELFV